MAAIELYIPQGAEMVSGMMYEPYEQGVIMRLEHHLVGGYVRYISPYIIIIIIITWASMYYMVGHVLHGHVLHGHVLHGHVLHMVQLEHVLHGHVLHGRACITWACITW